MNSKIKKMGFIGFIFFGIKGLIWLAFLLGFGKSFSNNKTIDVMKVSVYDTYVKKKDGNVMHFDILVPDSEKDTDKIHAYGRTYLATKGQAGQPLTSKECRFCHIEQADADVEAAIKANGYYIIEMQGCQ
jgi:Domain of unknown function (DUF2024)